MAAKLENQISAQMEVLLGWSVAINLMLAHWKKNSIRLQIRKLQE
jgi:hypothetical protein